MTSSEHSSPHPREDRMVGIPSNPMAASVGAVAAGATGAVVGSAAGPVGTVVGALVGAIVGGLGSDAIASAVREAHDAAYWRDNYATRPYAKPGLSYDAYDPAYALGESAQQRHGQRDYDAVVQELGQEWPAVRGASPLEWADAEPAIRDAWERRHARIPVASR